MDVSLSRTPQTPYLVVWRCWIENPTAFLPENQMQCLTEKLTIKSEEHNKTYIWLWNKGLAWYYKAVLNSAEMLRHDGQSATLLASCISSKPLLKNQNTWISETEWTKLSITRKLDYHYNQRQIKKKQLTLTSSHQCLSPNHLERYPPM